MSKKWLVGAVIGAVVVAAAVSAAKNQGGPKPSRWDKMREFMDEMPDDFPPRVMFANVEAIRANTDEMLELLRERAPESD